jgi:hypothetical protein
MHAAPSGVHTSTTVTTAATAMAAASTVSATTAAPTFAEAVEPEESAHAVTK